MADKKQVMNPEEAKLRDEQDREMLNALIGRVKAAQTRYAEYTQEQVDRIFAAAALAANAAAVGAAYNVRINLLSIADADFCARMRSDALAVLERVEKRAHDVRDVVERSFA